MESSESKPLVSIGIPTYNRAFVLRRAVESALAQDYIAIEVVISDNASTDETESLCEELRHQDNRVRYVRQLTNRGLAANFAEALNRSRGEFFMWLSDDDWLDSSYVSLCVQVLMDRPDHALVSGRGRHFQGEALAFEEDEVDLLQDDGRDRVVSHFRQVDLNSVLFGLMRREQLLRVPPMKNALGDDWILVASVAFTGKVRTLDDIFINRSLGGASHGVEHLYSVLWLFLKIAGIALRDIAWASPVYKTLGGPARLRLGCKVFAIVFTKFCMHTLLVRVLSALGRVLPAGLRTRLRTPVRMLLKRVTGR